MGVRPDGTRDPNGNDFWWDEEGRGNCWSGNAGPAGAAPSSNVLTGLPDCPGSSVFSPGIPTKTASQATCSTWDPFDEPGPARLRLVHPTGGARSEHHHQHGAARDARRGPHAAARVVDDRPRHARAGRRHRRSPGFGGRRAPARSAGPARPSCSRTRRSRATACSPARCATTARTRCASTSATCALLAGDGTIGPVDAGVPADVRQDPVGGRPRAAAGARTPSCCARAGSRCSRRARRCRSRSPGTTRTASPARVDYGEGSLAVPG